MAHQWTTACPPFNPLFRYSHLYIQAPMARKTHTGVILTLRRQKSLASSNEIREKDCQVGITTNRDGPILQDQTL
jgi:hypothetical protein